MIRTLNHRLRATPVHIGQARLPHHYTRRPHHSGMYYSLVLQIQKSPPATQNGGGELPFTWFHQLPTVSFNDGEMCRSVGLYIIKH